ncbi:16555_t:CDS:2, partial [Gigaspora margarita]
KDNFKKSCDQKHILKESLNANQKKIAPSLQNQVQNIIQENKLVASLQNEVQEETRPEQSSRSDKDDDIKIKQSNIQSNLIKEKYFKANKNVPNDNIQFEKI